MEAAREDGSGACRELFGRDPRQESLTGRLDMKIEYLYHADEDQVAGHEVVQELREDEDQHADDERDDAGEREMQIHGRLGSGATLRSVSAASMVTPLDDVSR